MHDGLGQLQVCGLLHDMARPIASCTDAGCAFPKHRHLSLAKTGLRLINLIHLPMLILIRRAITALLYLLPEALKTRYEQPKKQVMIKKGYTGNLEQPSDICLDLSTLCFARIFCKRRGAPAWMPWHNPGHVGQQPQLN